MPMFPLRSRWSLLTSLLLLCLVGLAGCPPGDDDDAVANDDDSVANDDDSVADDDDSVANDDDSAGDDDDSVADDDDSAGDDDDSAGDDDDSAGDDDDSATGPSLSIDSPSQGTSVDFTSVLLEMSVNDFTISTDVGGSPVAGEGHVHVLVDGVYQDFTTALDGTWVTNLGEGSHVVTVELVGNDHAPLVPAVSDSVTVTVNAGAQGITIDAPIEGASIDSSTLQTIVSTTNFTLDPSSIGDANVAGVGHYHVYIDGTYVGLSGSNQAAFFAQTPGDHELLVVLAENDHTELGAADHVRYTVTADRPGITITSPSAGSTVGGTFTVDVAVENFTLAPGSVGGANVPDEGHWHVYVDGNYVDYSATTSLSVLGLGAGPAVLRAELINNDHTVLSPQVFHEVDIVVQ